MVFRLRLRSPKEERADQDPSLNSTPAAMSPRHRRPAAPANNATSVTVSRSPSGSPEERRKSIKLTVKLPSSKLREVMTGREVKGLNDTLSPGEVVSGKLRASVRAREKNYTTPKSLDEDNQDAGGNVNASPSVAGKIRASARARERKSYGPPKSDEEDEDDEDENESDVVVKGGGQSMNDLEQLGAEAESSDDEKDEESNDEEDVEGESDEEEDAEGESDEDEDSEMAEPSLPPPPKVTFKQTPKANGKFSNPKVVVTPAANGRGPLKSVEQKEMDLDTKGEGEDEDLSELGSDDEGDDTNLGGDEDLVDDEDLEGEEDAEGEMDLDSDADTPGSGAVTPNLAALTKRNRGDDGSLMALDMGPQVSSYHFDMLTLLTCAV